MLFGAGASFGSTGVVPYRPPLGGGLYEDLSRRYPRAWGALPPGLARKFEDDFERGMLALTQEAGGAIPTLMQAMTDYFARFGLDGSGNDAYSRFLTGLVAEDLENLLFSSLNYECLLELAASRLGYTIEYGEAPLVDKGMRIWKLHGSCNFLPEGLAATRGVSFGYGVVFDSGIRPVSPSDARSWIAGDTALYPAMCLYTVDKPLQVGASVIGALQEAWARAIAAADVVVIIGTRPHDQDRHLWEPLADSPATVYFVGSHQSFYGWLRRTGRPKRRSHFVARRFDDGIEDVLDALTQ